MATSITTPMPHRPYFTWTFPHLQLRESITSALKAKIMKITNITPVRAKIAITCKGLRAKLKRCLILGT